MTRSNELTEKWSGMRVYKCPAWCPKNVLLKFRIVVKLEITRCIHKDLQHKAKYGGCFIHPRLVKVSTTCDWKKFNEAVVYEVSSAWRRQWFSSFIIIHIWNIYGMLLACSKEQQDRRSPQSLYSLFITKQMRTPNFTVFHYEFPRERRTSYQIENFHISCMCCTKKTQTHWHS